jgi:predicted Ser/Thr protein kinase
MTAQEMLPEKLGPYRVLARLGEGGMGVVYLAADAQQRRVAVKALRPAAADSSAVRRLAREVETMQRVRSPFVAEVIDADVTCDPPYIVTRYVAGRTLEDVVGERGPLAGPDLARLARGLAAALAAVHTAGVVHRDLKPANVMLAGGDPVVIDFGIAQAPEATRLTMTGMFMGTPGYLAPEVIEGELSGPASDVHSWGATVAFAATGRAPFGGGQFETIFYRIVNGRPDLAGIPAPLLPLVSQALARDPAARPGAMELCARTAALDPACLVPSAAAGAWPAGQPAAAAVAAGAVPQPTIADLAAARPGEAAAAAAAVAAVAAAAAGPNSASDVRDLLPPVAYPQPEPARPWWSGPRDRTGQPTSAAPPGATAQPKRGGPVAARPAPSASSKLLAVVAVLAAIAASAVLPVAGTAVALVGLIMLAAGDRAGMRLQQRISQRGPRVTDALAAAAFFPISLVWALLRALLLAPLALVAAGAAAAVTIIAEPGNLPRACGYGAAALVACYGLGPGSSRSRRPLRGFFDAVATSPATGFAVFFAIAVVATGAFAIAAAHPPFYWPLTSLGDWLARLHPLHSIVNLRLQLLRLGGKVAG